VQALDVIQHTSADYLGLMEDHLEGRRIRFRYIRPFTEKGRVPRLGECGDGLVLLGGGPWGSAGVRDLPTLAEEVELTRAFLALDRPVIGIELGAQILALAGGGRSEAAPLRFTFGEARRTRDDALNGFLPERFPHVSYLRDRSVLPRGADVLAVDGEGEPAVFQLGRKALGFTGHPGFKPAMGEDLIMEFEEGPEDPVPALEALRLGMREVEDALVWIMTGVVQVTGLMLPRRRIPIDLRNT
jgi:GMP synthase-like glutamine amidotransferase